MMQCFSIVIANTSGRFMMFVLKAVGFGAIPVFLSLPWEYARSAALLSLQRGLALPHVFALERDHFKSMLTIEQRAWHEKKR